VRTRETRPDQTSPILSGVRSEKRISAD
jgi:hypothetical protein